MKFILFPALVLAVTSAAWGLDDAARSNPAAPAGGDAAAPPRLAPDGPFEPEALYPPQERLIASPGNTRYFIDPERGDDSHAGTAPADAWRSFARLNAQRLAPGDVVRIAPGAHPVSLKPAGAGTAEKPVVIEFAPGRHVFAAERAVRRPYYISNACDAPEVPKPIGILMERVSHFQIRGGGKAGIVFAGRVIQFLNDRAEHLSYSGLTFDLLRPTVSEFRVVETAADSAVIRIAEGSTYMIEEGRFRWTGDLGSGGVMAQQAEPETGRCWRIGIGWDPFATARATELEPNKIRLVHAKANSRLKPGNQYQFRHTFRDSVGGHNTRCRNLVFRDCTFHNLTNMGIVSQFTENIAFERVHVVPPPDTIRTCPAWADGFHFSGCRGRVTVDGCRFSGLQDDPINVHGTHLRIVGKPADNQLRLRFMHRQTYGFEAFAPGDEVAVVSHKSLREFPGNPRRRVAKLERPADDSSGKEWLLTLDGPVPEFGEHDVIDNLSWYPDFTARNCHVTMDSCRGFLITTRGNALVEGCTFHRCAMPGILVADDAEGWFESGPIRDLTIRDNRFIGCGIRIKPENRSSDPDQPVHENIRIEDNYFEGAGVSAKSVRGLTVRGNRTPDGKLSVNHSACTGVTEEDNAAREPR